MGSMGSDNCSQRQSILGNAARNGFIVGAVRLVRQSPVIFRAFKLCQSSKVAGIQNSEV